MKKSFDKVNSAEYTEQSEKGLIFEVYLEYPQKLHDCHSYYPLATEKICVPEHMQSHYCEKIRQKYNTSIGQVKNVFSKDMYFITETFNCILILD